MKKNATLEAWIEGRWQNMGFLSLSDVLLFEYESEYIGRYLDQGIGYQCSLEHSVKFWPHSHKTWPAFLFDMMPSGYGRKALLSVLGGDDSKERDWEILTKGACQAPGNLRIKEALDWIQAKMPTISGPQIQELRSVQITDLEDLTRMGFLPGGSPVAGEAPKVALTKTQTGYFVSALDEPGQHLIVKLGFSEIQRVLLSQEYRYLQCAKACGLNVFGEPELAGPHLVIPRFDRIDSQIFPMHSAYSLLGRAGYGTHLKHEEILLGLSQYCFGEDLFQDCLEYLKRDLLADVLQVLDNHGRNTAFLVVGNKLRLSPLFDFSPMYLSDNPPHRGTTWENGYDDLLSDSGFFARLGLDNSRLKGELQSWKPDYLFALKLLFLDCDPRVKQLCEPRAARIAKWLEHLQ